MIPFEREIYLDMLVEKVEKSKQQNNQTSVADL